MLYVHKFNPNNLNVRCQFLLFIHRVNCYAPRWPFFCFFAWLLSRLDLLKILKFSCYATCYTMYFLYHCYCNNGILCDYYLPNFKWAACGFCRYSCFYFKSISVPDKISTLTLLMTYSYIILTKNRGVLNSYQT